MRDRRAKRDLRRHEITLCEGQGRPICPQMTLIEIDGCGHRLPYASGHAEGGFARLMTMSAKNALEGAHPVSLCPTNNIIYPRRIDRNCSKFVTRLQAFEFPLRCTIREGGLETNIPPCMNILSAVSVSCFSSPCLSSCCALSLKLTSRPQNDRIRPGVNVQFQERISCCSRRLSSYEA